MNNSSTQSTPDYEHENVDLTQLNALGNQAVRLGFIAGHGHRQGQYEILRQGEVLTFSPQAAALYFQDLLKAGAKME